MKNTVIRFDAFMAMHIAKLPEQWYCFFKYLGAFVRPGFWIAAALILAAIAFLASNGMSTVTFLLLAAWIPLSAIVKFFFKRDRPVTVYSQSMRIKSYSFPSSHSYAAAVGTVMLSYAASVASPELFLAVFILSGALALVVAISRVYVGAHYPSDVTGGLLLGIIVSLLIVGVINA